MVRDGARVNLEFASACLRSIRPSVRPLSPFLSFDGWVQRHDWRQNTFARQICVSYSAVQGRSNHAKLVNYKNYRLWWRHVFYYREIIIKYRSWQQIRVERPQRV